MHILSFVATTSILLGASSVSAADRCAPADSPDAPTGRSAYACGDTWAAGNAFEKDVLARPTVAARFNLAAAYSSTGRLQAAAEIYKTVVEDGAFTRLRLDPDSDYPGGSVRWVNASDEAVRRLDLVLARAARDRSPASVGAPSVERASVDAAEESRSPGIRGFTETIIAQSHVPDRTAAAFDDGQPAPEGE